VHRFDAHCRHIDLGEERNAGFCFKGLCTIAAREAGGMISAPQNQVIEILSPTLLVLLAGALMR
jgi:hypothetical protein